jgi:putative PEP-CTERM system TPR-repeat lipoprotein
MPRCVTKRAISASVVLSTLMLAAGLSGCGKTESSASLMADAKQYQQKGDNKAALIQLKNAATKSPQDAEVRFQLAVLYNQIGDPVSAEKEIRKAISLGVDGARTTPELAKAQLGQGQAQKAIDDSAAAAAKASPELLAIRGAAYLALNSVEKAKESYQQALAAKPGQAEALIGLARVAMSTGDIEGANRLTEQAVSANPKDPAVWVFKGSLLRAQNKPEQAIAAYSQAITLKPDHLFARIERAQLEIGAKQFDAAKADIDAAKKVSPNAMLVLYTQALLDFTQGKFAAAKESLQKVLRGAPEHMPTILLSGAVELNLGSFPQAEQHFKKYLEKFPDNTYARKLLAETLLKSSQPVDAAATLAPLLKDGSQDPQLLALAGESSMQTGDFTKATQYFEKASGLAPNVAGLHTSLGLAKFGQGDQAKAISELERATALDPKSEAAGVALVKAELGLKHYDKALTAVTAVVAAHPQSAAVRNLEGGVHMSKGNRAAARASFEKAASLQPDLFAAVLNLAQIDIADKKPDAAKQRLVAFVEKNKKSASAMAALASLAMNQKHPEEATTWLEKASAENPEAVGPATQLAKHYLSLNEKSKALTLIRKLQTANPANADLLDLLGQTQLASDDAAGALETYSKLVNVVPKSAAAHVRLATAHMKMKNEAAASDDLKKAIALDPGFLPAQLAQIDLAMAKGNTDQALVLARQLQKTAAKSPVGFLIEGDLLASQQKKDLALRAYEQAFAMARSPQALIKLADMMKKTGKASEADARLAQWQKEHPAEPMVAMYVGESYLAKKQYKPASEQFEAILKASPDNALVLNNLAWAYQEQKDPRALATAERALKLAPDSAAVMDTLGWMLVQQGNTSRGLPLLQKAVSLQPAATELRYHLAFALNKSGDKKNARQELDKLLSDNKPFPQIDEAKALLKIL